MNLIKDLFTLKELEEYKKLDYWSGVKQVYLKIKEKVAEDKNYEVFLPLVYFKFSSKNKFISTPVLKPHNFLISNLGRGAAVVKNKLKIYTPYLGSSGYFRQTVYMNPAYYYKALL